MLKQHRPIRTTDSGINQATNAISSWLNVRTKVDTLAEIFKMQCAISELVKADVINGIQYQELYDMLVAKQNEVMRNE